MPPAAAAGCSDSSSYSIVSLARGGINHREAVLRLSSNVKTHCALSDIGTPSRTLAPYPFYSCQNARMPTLAPSHGHDWTESELRELKRLSEACLGFDQWSLEVDKTDAGDPWCIIFDRRRQWAVVHVARIDQRYVTALPVGQRCSWSMSLTAAIDIALAQISPLSKRNFE